MQVAILFDVDHKKYFDLKEILDLKTSEDCFWAFLRIFVFRDSFEHPEKRFFRGRHDTHFKNPEDSVF